MRSLSAAESVRVASGAYAPALRVSVEDAGGVFRDVDSYFAGQKFLVGVSLQEDVDSQGPTASITLRRGIFDHSLSPLMLSSGTNRGYLPSASPSPAVALYRRVRVEWYVGAVDESQESPTWTELFVGRVDSINLADGENLTLECRDANVAVLSDSFFERERLYGLTPAAYAFQKGCLIWAPSEAQVVGDLLVPSTLNGYLYRCTTAGTTGTTEPAWPTVVGNTVTDGTAVWTCGVATAAAGTVSMEAVLQQMLNDSPVSLTLYAPDATAFLMSPWKQEREPVLEAARKVALLIGWDLRPRYDSAGAYRFQLYKPDRAVPSPARTFLPSQYLDVSTLSLGIEDVRNVLRVIYGDSADLGSDGKTPRRKYAQATDPASVSAYGRRFMEIAEEATSQIDTYAEASALVSAALLDLSTPYASLEVDAFFFPWAQPGDLYRFSANNVHFDSDQDLAVVGYSHEAQLGEDGEQSFRTTLTCRGKPSGGRDRWLQWDSRPGVAPSHSLHDSSGGASLVVEDMQGVAGGAKLRIQEMLDRSSKFDGAEIHVSTVSGFNPSRDTLAVYGKGSNFELQNLVPGQTYEACAVTRQFNAGRIVQGQPSARVSFTAGYAAPRLLQPGVDYGATPANGGFEAWTAGASVAPDAWTVRSGTWGTNMSRYTNTTSGFGNGGSGSYSVQFAANATGRLESATFAALGNVRIAANVLFYHPSSMPAANSVRVEVEWLNALGALLSTSTLDLSSVSGQEFVARNIEVTPPTGAAYGRVVCGRFASTVSSEDFILSDVRVDRLVVPGDGDVGTAQLADDSVTLAKLFLNLSDAATTVGQSAAVAQVGNSSITTTGTMSGWEMFANGGLGSNANRVAGIYGIYRTYGVANAGGDMVLATAKAGGAGAGLYERVRITEDGNVGVGTSIPITKFEARSTTTPGTTSTYGIGTGTATTTDLTFGADATAAYIQSWNSKPININSQGNRVNITQDSWIAPTLLNSFTNYDTSTWQAAGYYKDSTGRVWLRGLLKRASAALGTPIFTLPAGYRPAKLTLFALMAANRDGRLDVDASGNVFVPIATAADWFIFFSLDGISFDTR